MPFELREQRQRSPSPEPSEEAQPLEARRLAPATVAVDVGAARELQRRSRRTGPGWRSSASRDVLVVVGQRHDHRAVDPGPLHLREQRLGRRLGLRREELVHVAREALRDAARTRGCARRRPSGAPRGSAAPRARRSRPPGRSRRPAPTRSARERAAGSPGPNAATVGMPAVSWRCGGVGRTGEDADRPLVAEHRPARLPQGRDERVRRVDLGRRNPELEVELGVERRDRPPPASREEGAQVLLELLAGHARHRPEVAGELGLARVDAVEDAGLAP